ncbi:MAG: hypothetical protein BJ554DRAFT_734 [Olpidium bornovanus]|uniref:Uncharacterized protein n=1 Tax=Olpidium bornovanus TaxID=278681 RepID=A0A8H8DHN5_9FUNG|nr:MAG: hypothetical protein BJ554DRAFT_734 [Olpidium bornovanus]
MRERERAKTTSCETSRRSGQRTDQFGRDTRGRWRKIHAKANGRPPNNGEARHHPRPPFVAGVVLAVRAAKRKDRAAAAKEEELRRAESDDNSRQFSPPPPPPVVDAPARTVRRIKGRLAPTGGGVLTTAVSPLPARLPLPGGLFSPNSAGFGLEQRKSSGFRLPEMTTSAAVLFDDEELNSANPVKLRRASGRHADAPDRPAAGTNPDGRRQNGPPHADARSGRDGAEPTPSAAPAVAAGEVKFAGRPSLRLLAPPPTTFHVLPAYTNPDLRPRAAPQEIFEELAFPAGGVLAGSKKTAAPWDVLRDELCLDVAFAVNARTHPAGCDLRGAPDLGCVVVARCRFDFVSFLAENRRPNLFLVALQMHSCCLDALRCGDIRHAAEEDDADIASSPSDHTCRGKLLTAVVNVWCKNRLKPGARYENFATCRGRHPSAAALTTTPHSGHLCTRAPEMLLPMINLKGPFLQPEGPPCSLKSRAVEVNAM